MFQVCGTLTVRVSDGIFEGHPCVTPVRLSSSRNCHSPFNETRSEEMASEEAANSSTGTRIIVRLLNDFCALQQRGGVFDPDAGAARHAHHAVSYRDRRVEPGAVFLHAQLVFLVLADVLDD